MTPEQRNIIEKASRANETEPPGLLEFMKAVSEILLSQPEVTENDKIQELVERMNDLEDDVRAATSN